MEKKKTGFVMMDAEARRAHSSRGGKLAHSLGLAHEWTSDEARAAGKKGGTRISQNREHMAAIGRKGGLALSKNREHMSTIGRAGGLVRHGIVDPKEVING
jgi:general stress protein YciG